MRMVIDSNYLQCSALRDYLAASTDNYAVITDYAAMEAYKGDARVIYRCIEILAEYPEQVLILKGTQEVCGLTAHETDRPETLIDYDQARGFAQYCQALAAGRRGDRSVRSQLSQLGRDAADHMERVLADMPKLNRGFNQVEATYTPEELKILRRQGPITQKMGDKLVQQVMLLAAELFSTDPKVAKPPRGPEVRNTFIFRHAICAYALALRLISVGGAGKTHPEKLRNDLVDVNFATFATFFDGFLSADKKAQEVYGVGKYLLREVFAMPEAM
jgi:hypothetical protein